MAKPPAIEEPTSVSIDDDKREHLETLADSDLPCAWIADRLLELADQNQRPDR